MVSTISWLGVALTMGLLAPVCAQEQAPEPTYREAPRAAPPRAATPPPAEAQAGCHLPDAAGTLEIDFEGAPVGGLPEGLVPAETNGVGRPATWSVEGCDEAPSGAQVLRIGGNENCGHAYSLVLVRRASLEDVTVSVRLKALGGREDRGGGVLWRARNDNNYYLARWNPLEDDLRLYVVRRGIRTLIARRDVAFDHDAWHLLTTRMNGDRIEVSMDGTPILSGQDDSLPGAGLVGLWVKADAEVLFDDFLATPVLSAPPSPVSTTP